MAGESNDGVRGASVPRMPLDPRLPVLVAGTQALRRPVSAADQHEPLAMLAGALRDAVKPRLLAATQAVYVTDVLSWRYPDAPGRLAGLLGIEPRHRVRVVTGGNGPQQAVNDAARRIQAGQLDVAVVGGAEAMATRLLARKQGAWLDWPPAPSDASPTDVLGVDRPGSNDAEMARSLALPVQVYALLESALRAAAGLTVEEHRRFLGELWARFSVVAAANPHAWSPQVRTPEDLMTVTPDNRLICSPYPKQLNANIQTDQAAGVVIASVEAARRAGVPEERWVFVRAGADAHDHWWVSERADLVSSPALAACSRAIDADADAVDHLDVYSCFPSAVQIGANALGVDLARPLTVTGGLAFAGGPGNSYANHSIATMADVLRADPGAVGLTTAVGWYMTKHSIGVYSTTPPAHGYRWANPQAEVDARPKRALAAESSGDVTIEAHTVAHERDGTPSLGIVACLRPDGSRAWANTRDADLLEALATTDQVGTAATLTPTGTIHPPSRHTF